MKKSIYSLLALTLAVGVIFTSCAFSDPKEKESDESEEIDTITEAGVAAGNENVDIPSGGGTGNSPSDNDNSSDYSEEPSSEEEVAYDGTLIGYSSKNYPITVKDGLTYVDGVLIANKSYALPASYDPGDLLSECKSAFDSLQSAAAGEGLTIWNASGFRSYSLQESLYNRYCNRDGQAAADRYSARPGHSEHQTGLAIDLNTITQAFADTAEGRWIAENCWRYGFILRYPKGKEAQTGYMYEPWHIRYVGTEAAEKIYASGLCLEEYYGITSEYGNAPSDEEPESESITEAVSEPVSEEATQAVTEPAPETTKEGIIYYG